MSKLRPSRREFMAHAGKLGLALPFLPPFLSTAFGADEAGKPPLRFIQLMMNGGMIPYDFWPQIVPSNVVGTNIHTMKLRDVPDSDISTLMRPFAKLGLLDKISFIRGTGMTSPGFGDHNAWNASTNGGLTNGKLEFPYSIDQVLARKIYSKEPNMRSLVTAPVKGGGYEHGEQAYHRCNSFFGSSDPVTYLHHTNTVISSLFGGGSSTGSADIARAVAKKQKIVDIQKKASNRILASTSLRAKDRPRLQAFESLLNELKMGFTNTPSGACTPSTANAENNSEDVFKNQAMAIAAAFACDSTRVAALTTPHAYDPIHALQHDASPERTGDFDSTRKQHAAIVLPKFESMAYLMNLLNNITEIDGSKLLDNCVILIGAEHGTGRMAHDSFDMATIIGGGARGLLRMGEYIDYRTDQEEHFWYDAYDTPGKPYGNVLISILNAFGLSSSQYEQNGIAGFGNYDRPGKELEKYCTTAERRKPLEYFYTGPVRG